MHRKVIYIVFNLILIPGALSKVSAQEFPHVNKRLNIESKKDTLPKTPVTTATLDTVKRDSVKPKQGQKLETPMFRTSKDY